MGQLEHPNIVPVYDIGVDEGWQVLLHDARAARPARSRRCSRRCAPATPRMKRRYSLTRLVQIFLQITQAMSYAHAKGVLHRDLKPANLMLGEHGEVQVLDWGLSKVYQAGGVETHLERSLTVEGNIVGTPHYMAPEQAEGKDGGCADRHLRAGRDPLRDADAEAALRRSADGGDGGADAR